MHPDSFNTPAPQVGASISPHLKDGNLEHWRLSVWPEAHTCPACPTPPASQSDGGQCGTFTFSAWGPGGKLWPSPTTKLRKLRPRETGVLAQALELVRNRGASVYSEPGSVISFRPEQPRGGSLCDPYFMLTKWGDSGPGNHLLRSTWPVMLGFEPSLVVVS